MALAPTEMIESTADQASELINIESVVRLREQIQKKIVTDIQDMWGFGKTRCAPIWKDFRRYRDLYRGIIQRRYTDGLANVNIPLTLENVEALTAQLIGSIFAGEKYVKGIPGEGASMRSAHSAETLVHVHCARTRLDEKFRRLLSLWVILCGTGIFKLGWKHDKRHQLRRVMDPQTRIAAVQPVERVVADHIEVTIVDLCAFVPSHIEAEEIDQLDWTIERSVMDKRQLLERQLNVDDGGMADGGRYINIHEIPQSDWQDLPLATSEQRMSKPNQAGGGGSSDRMRETKTEVLEWWGQPLWERWAPELIRDTQEAQMLRALLFKSWGLSPADAWLNEAVDWRLEVAGEKGTLISISPNRDANNTNPYHKLDWIPLANEFYGLGVGEIGESQHLEANAKANMGLDERTKALDSMKAVRWAGLDHQRIGSKWETHLKWRRNGIVWTRDDPNSVISDLQPPPVQRLADESVGFVRESARTATGAVDVIHGQSTGAETATENQQISAYAQTRLGMQYFYLDRKLARQLFPAIYANIQAYSTQRSILTMLGEAGIHEPRVIEPEDLVGEIYFQLAGAQRMQQDVIKRQQLVGFLQTAGNTPIFAMAMMQAAPKLLRQTAEAFQIQGADEMFPDPIAALAEETSPDEENEVLMAGMDAQVKMTDRMDEHLPLHVMAMTAAQQGGAPDSVIKAFERHIRTHVALAQYLFEQMAMLAGQQQQPAGRPNRSPGDESRSAMQRGQLNQDANTSRSKAA